MEWQFEFKGDRGWKAFSPDGNMQVNNAISRPGKWGMSPFALYTHHYTDPKEREQETRYKIDLQTMKQWQEWDSVNKSSKVRDVRAFKTADASVWFEFPHAGSSSNGKSTEEPQTQRGPANSTLSEDKPSSSGKDVDDPTQALSQVSDDPTQAPSQVLRNRPAGSGDKWEEAYTGKWQKVHVGQSVSDHMPVAPDRASLVEAEGKAVQEQEKDSANPGNEKSAIHWGDFEDERLAHRASVRQKMADLQVEKTEAVSKEDFQTAIRIQNAIKVLQNDEPPAANTC